MSSPVKKEYIAQKRVRETERTLLPDAPDRRRSRKKSPQRVPCRLSVGTPTTPPSPKVQSLKSRKMAVHELKGTLTPLRQDGPDTPSSTVIDSFVDVPGCSPLVIDWTTGNLKPEIKISPVKMKFPPQVNDMVGGESTETSSCSSAKQPNTITVCGSGMDEANIIFEEWIMEEGAGELHDSVEGCGINFVEAEPADIHSVLDEDEAGWLTQEDREADRLLQDMIPNDHLTFDWSNDYRSFHGQRENFVGPSGPTFTISDSYRPVDIFLKYFDNELLDLIVHETNKYSTHVIAQVVTEKSRFNFWRNTDRSEICVFFSILLFQGLAPLTVETDYWRENGYLTLKYFKNIMNFNRYVLLKRMLHFNDVSNLGQDKNATDEVKLCKISPVLKHLNNKFSSLYLPGRDIAIDESLLKWYGRLSFSQRISRKAAKVGVKSYELCESSTGYLWKFFIYTGKHTDKSTDDRQVDDEQTDDEQTDDGQIDDARQTEDGESDGRPLDILTQKQSSESSRQPPPSNATARIVYDLAKPLFNRGHTITMDNFFNSPLLARYLKSQGTDCFGTLRVNREFVPESIKTVAKSELRIGEMVQSFTRDLMVMMWRDINVVSMLSTFHTGIIAGKEKRGQFKYIPQMVLDYNMSMGGVDKKDQLLASFPLERSRTQVWYKKVFRRLLNVTVLNAYILYKTVHKTTSHRAFRFRLAEELIQIFKPPEIKRPLQVVHKSLVTEPGGIQRPILSGNHYIGLGASKYARCLWCKQRRSKYICKQCNVTLCLETCFEEFHSVRTRKT